MSRRPQTLESAQHAVLCVDDEPQLLEAIALTLGHRYYIELAPGGHSALDKLRTLPKLSVIVSDMRMPKMDGAEFFNEARRIAPKARRIILTGHADIKSAIAAVNDGRVFRYLTKPCSSAELIEAVEAAIADFEADMHDYHVIRESVEREFAGSDRMTGLASRELLIEQLCLLQSRAPAASGTQTALFLIDVRTPEGMLEDFDTHAFEGIIRELAKRLRAEFASADCLARPGSNSSAVVLTLPCPSEGTLRETGLRILGAIGNAVNVDGVDIRIPMTIGVASATDDADEPQALLRHAELAAREARQPGGIPVAVFSQASHAKAEYRRDLSRALRVSVSRQELTLHYQPIIDVAANCLHSIEALARWQHPHFGFISPATFIPLIEQLGLMVPFGEWVLSRACAETRDSWERQAHVHASASMSRSIRFSIPTF